MIPLGSVVKDNITGFTGVATARVTYLRGDDCMLVEAAIGEKGGVATSLWIVEPRLDIVRGRSRKGGKRN